MEILVVEGVSTTMQKQNRMVLCLHLSDLYTKDFIEDFFPPFPFFFNFIKSIVNTYGHQIKYGQIGDHCSEDNAKTEYFSA